MKRRLFTPAMTILLLCLAVLTLGVALSIADWRFIPLAAAAIILICVACLVNASRIRKLTATVLHGAGFTRESGAGLGNMNLPVAVVADKNIVWYNRSFRQAFLAKGGEACLAPVKDILPQLDCAKAAEAPMAFTYGNREYTVYGGYADKRRRLFAACFADDTLLKQQSREYAASRPAVLAVTVDTYNEILRDLKESERSRIVSEIDTALDKYFSATSGFLRRTSDNSYIAIIEERHMQQLLSERFSILDTVRALGDDNTAVTLSIGAGHGAGTLRECEAMAMQALDMALGRGGDQAAVMTPDGFTFFGGVTRSVEKRSKVKSRIIAGALQGLIRQSDSVLIMGHKHSDLDALGAAAGMLRFCKMCQKPSAVVIHKKQTLAGTLLRAYERAGLGDDFIEPEECLQSITPSTLLIVVDTHIRGLLDSSEVFERCRNVVVIDHHRKCVGHIDNATVFYHEPYASSACELVAELLSNLNEKENRPTPLDAQALLAGIVLDTREFSLNAGVRTFEAAAYLRRLGAQTQEVKKLFANSFENYAYKAQLVTDAKIFMGCAMVFSGSIPGDLHIVAAQAANDLLGIEGVDASFVGIDNGQGVNISARSMGAVNVQVIMEALGGGGHLTMAGAQIKGKPIEEVQRMLRSAISDYREAQEASQNAQSKKSS